MMTPYAATARTAARRGAACVAAAAGARTLRWAVARLDAGGRLGAPGTWDRTNHRGEPVTLLAGPVAAISTAAAVLTAPVTGRVRAAAVLAVAGAGTLGGYDDLAGSGDDRGFRGHARALARGEVTTGAVKVLGIGTSGLLAGALLRRNAVDAVLAGGVVAGTANLLNLLDLRPGRALKAALLLSAPALLRPGPGGDLLAGPVGTAVALLPDDLGERAMLGDAGANALGAAVGTALAAGASRRSLALHLAGLAALTAASERVSFTRVIDVTPGLRELDGLGRRPR